MEFCGGRKTVNPLENIIAMTRTNKKRDLKREHLLDKIIYAFSSQNVISQHN